jgi:hypothetical protein
MRVKLTVICSSLLLLGLAANPAQAHWGVGISVGIPIFFPPCYPCYRPYPVYYAPAPVYVQPAPVYVQPAPIYVQPAPAPAPAPVPAPAPQPATSSQPSTPPAQASAPAVTPAIARGQAADDRQSEITNTLEHLRNPDEQARADAVTRLGRLKAQRAIDPLAATLAGDSSAKVREAAAKALGIIGSPKALPSLQRAAKNDADRDVRHTAQFAIELVEANR